VWIYIGIGCGWNIDNIDLGAEMNDFTKEELEDLVSWGNVYTEFGHSWTDRMHRPLIEKLQSLIDNYCNQNEHRYSPTDALNVPLHCLDCGEKFE